VKENNNKSITGSHAERNPSCSGCGRLSPSVCPLRPSGYVLGYISHREKAVEAANCGHSAVTPDDYSPEEDSPEADAQMDWDDVTQLLKQKLTSQAFDKTLRCAVHTHTHTHTPVCQERGGHTLLYTP